VAATGSPARLYVCGITPYDATHLGHAATYVGFDLLQRQWRDRGLAVRYAQNVTDVDDPLLARASETGEAWERLAERETALFCDDMAALRVLPPDHFVGVTESIPLIVDVVERLRSRGAAYELDGDVYFAVGADPSFGGVSGLDGEAMRALFAERGGDPDRPGKKDPLDPVLWLRKRPGEPSWSGPLGPGRPGWHVECTAIALRHLGSGFDVQGGGSDLTFPHHELSASHAHALGGGRFAQTYVHAGMVGLHGAKMSKSRGNLVLVSALRRAGRDPAAIRLALLDHHYRSDWDWTEGDLSRAEQRLARWRAAVGARSGADARPLLGALRARLADDLDAPGALAAIDDWAAADGSDPAAPELAADAVDALLGVDVRERR
jgi:L-cysteine:1D-myo-inositol 2-amino-2-deoxy-alpha-D-glucopyranoside ligase